MKFTIGIPAYKASFLEECISSVLNQTYEDFQLIIVNDNSPENLDCILDKFSDNRILYSKNEKNFGAENVIFNWNKCLSLARGEYFILLGDDDKMDLNFLKEFALKINEFPELNVYHCQSFIINEESQIIDITVSLPTFETVHENIWNRIINNRRQFISDFVYRTSFLKQNKGFYYTPLAWAADDISSFIAAKDLGIAHINKPLLWYRRNRQTITNSGNFVLKMKAVNQEYFWYNNFLAINPSVEKDLIFKKRIEINIDEKFDIKKALLVANSLQLKFWFYSKFWILNKKQYLLTYKHLIHAYFLYLKSTIRA